MRPRLSSKDFMSLDNETDPLAALRGMGRLSAEARLRLCGWLSYGYVEHIESMITPMGSLLIFDWSSEVDSLIHELVSGGMANLVGDYVYVPQIMRWTEFVTIQETCTEPEDYVEPSPMSFQLPPVDGEVPEDDLAGLLARRIMRSEAYMGGVVVQVMREVRSLGVFTPLVFREPIDLAVITGDNYVIGHKIIDPRFTAHRGYSAIRSYLSDGVDMAILVHHWVSDRFHVDTFNRILRDSSMIDSGYLVMSEEILLYKWPRRNTLILRSPSIAAKNHLMRNMVSYVRSKL